MQFAERPQDGAVSSVTLSSDVLMSQPAKVRDLVPLQHPSVHVKAK